MKCPKCGNEAQADAIFCDQCGTRLTQDRASVAAPAAPSARARRCAARSRLLSPQRPLRPGRSG